MSRFMLVYNGEATDLSQMTEDEGAKVLAGWTAWMSKVGEALVDVGTPFGAGTSVVDDGSTGSAIPLSGYSIVEAPSLEQARLLAEGHPFLSEGRGRYAIEVYEMMPVPFQA